MDNHSGATAAATATETNNNKEKNFKYNGGGFVIGGPLETAKSERHVWLMKCPPSVARSLKQHEQEKAVFDSTFNNNNNSSGTGPVAAKVVVSVDPLLPNEDVSSTQFTMELLGTESGNEPKCYCMNMSTDLIPMGVFNESAQGKVSAEGKIHHKFDMKPHSGDIELYRKFCRERTDKSNTKIRQIQVIDNDNGARMRPMPGVFAFKSAATTDKKKLATKGSDLKRTRRGRAEMEGIMFKLFERQSNWTLKNLLHETDQPEQFLKDILKDLCVYNNKGSNQGTYELKPEYKRSTEEPESK